MKSNINLNIDSPLNQLDSQNSFDSSKLSLTSLIISDSDEDISFKEKNTQVESVTSSPLLNRMFLSQIKY